MCVSNPREIVGETAISVPQFVPTGHSICCLTRMNDGFPKCHTQSEREILLARVAEQRPHKWSILRIFESFDFSLPMPNRRWWRPCSQWERGKTCEANGNGGENSHRLLLLLLLLLLFRLFLPSFVSQCGRYISGASEAVSVSSVRRCQ